MSMSGAYGNAEKSGQFLVETPFGKGLVVRIRPRESDEKGDEAACGEVKEVRLLEWENAAEETRSMRDDGGGRLAKGGKGAMLYTRKDYESVEIRQGSSVMTSFGRGKVLNTVTVRIRSKLPHARGDLLAEQPHASQPRDGPLAPAGGSCSSSNAVHAGSCTQPQTQQSPSTEQPPGQKQEQQEEQEQKQEQKQEQEQEQEQEEQEQKQEQKQEQEQEEGEVCRKERVLTKYQVELTSWRLAGRSTVKCFLFQSSQLHHHAQLPQHQHQHQRAPHQPPPSPPPPSPPPPPKQTIRSVRPKTLPEMTAWERVELAMAQKQSASSHFQKRLYQSALNLYSSAVDAVRYVQHDSNSTNECRADLIEVMVTCSNNAATCCVHLDRYADAAKFATNALVLLDALWEKRGGRIHRVLLKGRRRGDGHVLANPALALCDAKIFGEWRIKSYLIVSRAALEKDDNEQSIDVLRKARDLAASYTTQQLAEQAKLQHDSVTLSSIGRLQRQQREVKKLMAKSMDRKKQLLKKERARAQAMFGANATTTTTTAAATAAGGNNGIHSQSTNGLKPNGFTPNRHKLNAHKPEPSTNTTSKTNPESQTDQKEDYHDEDALMAQVEKLIANQENNTSQSDSMSSSFRSNSSDSGPTRRRKSVSFSPNLEERLIIESRNGDAAHADAEEPPWYDEHKEALILLAIGGVAAVSSIFMRPNK